MKKMIRPYLICLMTLFLPAPAVAVGENSAPALYGFKSDGCSLFPDGNLEQRDLWCDCCFVHDIAYWQGGTQRERKQADEALRDCVLDRTQNKTLTILMYDGVRTGGHPAFPTWYRWGYGWSYGRGYQALAEEEQQQAREKLEDYFKKYPSGYCKDLSDQKTTDERRRP